MFRETDFLDRLRAAARPSDAVPIPVGDDLAAIRWAGDLLLVGVDQVLDGVHFDLACHAPELIGRKAMNRNLSDCAAMACLPAAAVVTLALPRSMSLDDATRLQRGMTDAASNYDCPIVGGDTTTWPGPLAVTVTILGRSDGVAPLTRTGASPGDDLYVTGPLGGSLLRDRHLTFAPRVAEARRLAAAGATAMIDLSDGLSLDLARLCAASGVGATLDAASVPVHPDAAEMARADGRTPLDHALNDGEDYELLLSAPPSARGAIESAGGVRVGSTHAGADLRIDVGGEVVALQAGGWNPALGDANHRRG